MLEPIKPIQKLDRARFSKAERQAMQQMNTVVASHKYFDVREVPYANVRWTYVDAHRVLLVVYGLTCDTQRLVLIRQYRPPVDASVLSAPMGCFPNAPIEQLLPIAAKEAEGETGHRVLGI